MPSHLKAPAPLSTIAPEHLENFMSWLASRGTVVVFRDGVYWVKLPYSRADGARVQAGKDGTIHCNLAVSAMYAKYMLSVNRSHPCPSRT